MLTSFFRKITECKVTAQLIVFLYTSSDKLKSKFKNKNNTIYNSSKGCNRYKSKSHIQDLYSENYKVAIKEDLNDWKSIP